MPKDHDDSKAEEERRSEANAYSAGLEFGMTILVFVGIGWFLDSRLHTIPLFLLIFMFLGFGGALYSLTKKFPSDSPAPKKRAPADSAQNVTKPPDRNDSGESEDNNSSAQD